MAGNQARRIGGLLPAIALATAGCGSAASGPGAAAIISSTGPSSTSSAAPSAPPAMSPAPGGSLPPGVMSAARACRQVIDRARRGFFTRVEGVHLVLTTYAKGEPAESQGDISTGMPPRTLVWVVEVHAKAIHWNHSVPSGYQPPVDDLPGQVQDSGIVVQHEVGVGDQDDSVQLEGELVRVLVRGKLVLLKRGHDEAPDQRHELRLERGDQFLDRARAGAHLQRGAGHKAASRESTALQVIEERLAHRGQLSQTGGSREGGLHHFFLENPARFRHGGQLEFLLGAEVRVQAALAHANRR